MPEPDTGEAPARPTRDELMDLDLDLDPSWTLDPASAPSSPFLLSFFSSPQLLSTQQQLPLSSSEQPSSPLWAFSDIADEKSGNHSASLPPGGLLMADCSRFVSYNLGSMTGNIAEDVQKSRKLLQASVGIATEDNDSDESCIIKERMTQALRNFKDSIEQHFLVQVWAPVKDGDRYVLTTSGQPFALDPHSSGLLQYRTVSLMYLFSVDGENGDMGLPGRVFRQKLPEWTPNVQYYNSTEYPRRKHALNYNVRGTLALPVFEPSGQSCVGVVELIMTSQKINYATEVDKVCKALEAVNLKSSDILEHPNRQICNEGRQAALGEILEMLTVVCETHKLPLAQTWIPCMHRSVLAHGGGSKKSCTSFDGSCMGQVCMSTTDVAVYVVDAHMWGFRDACAEHHLQKGQGAAGRAFLSHRPCFARNVTQFCKTEYPLVHYARMFGLLSCLAICLRSSLTGSDDYIVEFFLPPSCVDPEEQDELLDFVTTTMSECFRSLKVFTSNELQEEGILEIIEPNIDGKLESKIKCGQMSPQSSFISKDRVWLDGQGLGDLDNELSVLHNVQGAVSCKEVDSQKNENKVENANGQSLFPDNKSMKPSDRRRGKTEKSISLEVLQQYFAGSLKDAAKSLGVCPTTMKRICRQHGISRWPSRKINKVNRSLSKLKRVIESVQGTEGAFCLASLASPLPVSVGSISLPVNLDVPTILPSEATASHIHGITEKGSPSQKTVENGYAAGIGNGVPKTSSSHKNIANNSLPVTKTRSGSGAESTETPASEYSCQGSPGDEVRTSNLQLACSIQELGLNTSSSRVLEQNREASLLAAYGMPDTLTTTDSLTQLGGMLVEDSGSCKDFRDLCNFATDGYHDEVPSADPPNVKGMPPLACTMPHPSASQEVRTVTIKASYKEDIIRFRLPLSSGLVELKEEISKRLKLDIGTFDIKYLDDDHEWVLVACDADLQECLEVARASGGNLIRLTVHDIMANLGSSCESTGE